MASDEVIMIDMYVQSSPSGISYGGKFLMFGIEILTVWITLVHTVFGIAFGLDLKPFKED